MSVQKVVAIDGPSGSGKSTITKKLASSLSLLYIDTGAMYRAVALYLDETKVDLSNNQSVKQALENMNLVYSSDETKLISIAGENRTQDIRQHHVSELASHTSQIPEVREFLVDFQRSLATEHVCIMEGRDIGTVVFPTAFLKIYLSADSMKRAERRFKELQQKGDTSVTLEQVHEDVVKRDQADMQREIAPLKKADDAVEVDSTQLSIDEVISKIAGLVTSKANEIGIQL